MRRITIHVIIFILFSNALWLFDSAESMPKSRSYRLAVWHTAHWKLRDWNIRNTVLGPNLETHSSHNFELVLIRIMQGDNLSRDDSVMISLRIVFQCSHFSIDCHICYPDSPRLWTPLRGCVLSGCWAGSEFFQDPQDFLSSGCTLYKFWAVGTPGSPSPIS